LHAGSLEARRTQPDQEGEPTKEPTNQETRGASQGAAQARPELNGPSAAPASPRPEDLPDFDWVLRFAIEDEQYEPDDLQQVGACQWESSADCAEPPVKIYESIVEMLARRWTHELGGDGVRGLNLANSEQTARDMMDLLGPKHGEELMDRLWQGEVRDPQAAIEAALAKERAKVKRPNGPAAGAAAAGAAGAAAAAPRTREEMLEAWPGRLGVSVALIRKVLDGMGEKHASAALQRAAAATNAGAYLSVALRNHGPPRPPKPKPKAKTTTTRRRTQQRKV
jgi:hypothetical protein